MERRNQIRPTTSALVNGATVLGLAALVSKLLGTLQKIPMQNIGGDEAFGIYNAVFPFYTLILFLATAGFPIAVSKFVAEFTAGDNINEARRVVYIASVILTATGIIFAGLLFFGAGWIAGLIHNEQTKLAIQSVSFALVFVPIMAVLRGYFQGMQNMMPTGISQVIEQMVRVGTMVALLLYFTSLQLSEEWIAAGATFGSVTGACAGLLVMVGYWWKDRRRVAKVTAAIDRESNSRLTRRLLLYALPVCLGAIVVPILSIVDTFTIPRVLRQNGLDTSASMVHFGLYARGLPLVQLVAMLFSSLSVALVPAIAEAKFRGDMQAINIRSELSIRFTWLIGWAASLGLAMAAVPINIMFFKNDAGTLSMTILAFTAVFSALNIISASVLQGLGSVLIPAFSLLVAAVIKVCLNLIWIPLWGIEGAAASAVVTFLIAAFINIAAIRVYNGFSFSWTYYIFRPFLALALMGITLWIWLQGWEAIGTWLTIDLSNRGYAVLVALTAVGVGAFVYLIALFWVGAIHIRDLQHVPSVGKRLIPILRKLRMIKV